VPECPGSHVGSIVWRPGAIGCDRVAGSLGIGSPVPRPAPADVLDPILRAQGWRGIGFLDRLVPPLERAPLTVVGLRDDHARETRSRFSINSSFCDRGFVPDGDRTPTTQRSDVTMGSSGGRRKRITASFTRGSVSMGSP
jgi:hypothetical protein